MISVNPTYGFFDPIKSAKYRVKAKKNIMRGATRLSESPQAETGELSLGRVFVMKKYDTPFGEYLDYFEALP